MQSIMGFVPSAASYRLGIHHHATSFSSTYPWNIHKVANDKMSLSSKNGEGMNSAEEIKPSKPKSRLAQLAEDWLEEEEDELQLYWERFDDKEKADLNKVKTDVELFKDESQLMTTEERLERYYDSRGINKGKEKRYSDDIQQAIKTAQAADTPERAIRALEKVQPYLQVNTRLGGTALYELCIALWQRGDEPDSELMERLLGNQYVKGKIQQLIKRGPPTRVDNTSVWGGFFNPSQWWN